MVVPQMLEEYTLRPAKGSTGWAYNHDQSMLAHILNGIFPTLTIARIAGQPLNELEERLYLIAYSFHDIDKLEGIRDLSVSDAEKSERFYSYLDEWVLKLQFDKFCPDYKEYRGRHCVSHPQHAEEIRCKPQFTELRFAFAGAPTSVSARDVYGIGSYRLFPEESEWISRTGECL